MKAQCWGKSHTTPEGKAFGMKIMDCLNAKKNSGPKKKTYNLPIWYSAESLTHRFVKSIVSVSVLIEDVMDKGYYTNSYHVDVRENIDVFSKFSFEAQFQEQSTGGMISYVEIPYMEHNTEAILAIISYL